MACSTCKGKGWVRLGRRVYLPGSVVTLPRHARRGACPTCLGTPRT